MEGELARFAGNGGLAGTDLELAWVPGEQFRYSAGLRGDLSGGKDWSARSLRPLAGVSWTTPAGPTLAASLAGGLSVPWSGREAAASPYSFFAAAPVPERELANFTLSAWQEAWDQSLLRADFRVREVRRALSWAEVPGEALYAPAAVPDLSLRELALTGEWNGFEAVTLFGEATWRDYTAGGGLVAGLSRAEGRAGGEYKWRDFRFTADLAAQRDRPRSVAGGRLAPFEDLGLGAAWAPLPWLEASLKGRNLLAREIQLWGGYPEPKRLLTAGLLAKF
jgi:hypothetical protein